jgi:hypothetical protein
MINSQPLTGRTPDPLKSVFMTQNLRPAAIERKRFFVGSGIFRR